MKNIKVFNNKYNRIVADNILDNINDFIEFNISINAWGKPERWVLAKELMENGNTEEPEHWMWHSEYYEESDVLQTEVRTRSYIVNEVNELGHTVEVEKEEKETWVLLKADYTIEVIDLDADYDWLLSECHRKRKAEYPQITELADALYWKEQGNNFKYVDYINKCDAIKKKYPLPLKQNDETQESTE